MLTGRPANPVDRLPVLVFIHGESFDWGSSLLYDGSLLSSYSNLVVVTLNFRLGVLGKECTPDPDPAIDLYPAVLETRNSICAAQEFGGATLNRV